MPNRNRRRGRNPPDCWSCKPLFRKGLQESRSPSSHYFRREIFLPFEPKQSAVQKQGKGSCRFERTLRPPIATKPQPQSSKQFRTKPFCLSFSLKPFQQFTAAKIHKFRFSCKPWEIIFAFSTKAQFFFRSFFLISNAVSLTLETVVLNRPKGFCEMAF